MGTADLLANYQSGYESLEKELSQIPEEAFYYKPLGQWSIAEIIIHLADSEAQGFVCSKKIIAECGGRVCVYNRQIWADKLFYENMNYQDALAHIRIIRKNLYRILKLVPDATWNNYIFHPETGKLTLIDWLVLTNDHVDVHVEQIRQTHMVWRELHEKVLA